MACEKVGVKKVESMAYLRLSLEVIVHKFDCIFKVWFFEPFAKPNRPKNMVASLGFFGLVRPLLSLLSHVDRRTEPELSQHSRQ